MATCPIPIRKLTYQSTASLDPLDLCIKFIDRNPKKLFQILRLPASWFLNAPNLDPLHRDILTKVCTVFSEAIGIYNLIQIFPSANHMRHSSVALITKIEDWKEGEKEDFPLKEVGTFLINDLIPITGSIARALYWLNQKNIIDIGVITTPVKAISALSLLVLSIKGIIQKVYAFHGESEKSENLEINGRNEWIAIEQDILNWLELFASFLFFVSISPAVIGFFITISFPAFFLVILTAISLGLGIIIFGLKTDIEDKKEHPSYLHNA